MGSPALVSVVIPAYNAAATLSETVESLLAQTHTAWEAIIVDDGSRDETPAIAAEYARRDPRIRLVRQDNAGVGAARNRGIAEARGAFIAPLDADDIWLPQKLEKQLALLQSRGEEWGFCSAWSESINERGEVFKPLKRWPMEGRVLRALIYRNMVGNASVPLFRASALRKVGGYRTRAEQGGAQGCEDWDLTLRVAEHFLMGEVPDYLVGYRSTSTRMSSSTASMARSYEFTMSSLRQRHPELPAKLFRWSAGHFYLYQLNISYNGGDYAACFPILRKIIASDPAMLLCPTIYRVAPMSLLRRYLGAGFLKRAALKNLLSAPQDWIETRRWDALREEVH